MRKAMYPPNVVRAFNGMTGGLRVIDIDVGRDEDSGQFALRCALERITDLEVAVSDTAAEFYNKDGEVVLEAILSQEVMDWTLDFDEGQPVHPIQLILREIDKQWGVYKTYAAQTPITYHPIPESVEVLVEPFGKTWEGAISENGRLDYVIDGGGRYFFTMEELYAHGVRRLSVNNTYELNITIG